MGLIDGKVALVTGAGTGHWPGIRDPAGSGGCNRCSHRPPVEPLEEVAAEIKKQGGKAISPALDIESRAAIF